MVFTYCFEMVVRDFFILIDCFRLYLYGYYKMILIGCYIMDRNGCKRFFLIGCHRLFLIGCFVDRPLWPSLTICYPPIGPRPGRTNPLRSVLHAGNKVDLCQITDIRNKAVWVVIFVWGGGCRLSFLNYYSIMYKFRDVYKIKLIES